MRPVYKFRALAALLLGAIVLLGAGDDSARLEALGHKVICMCGCNQILQECNHYRCPYLTPEHQELVAAIDRGDTDTAILKAFVEEYGPTVLAAPSTKGFELIAWLMPYLALALGVFGVVVAVRSWRGRFPAEVIQGGLPNSQDLDRFRAQARRETEL